MSDQARERRSCAPWSGRHDHAHPAVRAFVDDRTFGERIADHIASFGGSSHGAMYDLSVRIHELVGAERGSGRASGDAG